MKILAMSRCLVKFVTFCALPLSLYTVSAKPLEHRLLGSSFGIPGDNATFDYVIVGGGNAGLTLATRLAEQQAGRVAVVEAGGFYEISNSNLSQVPAGDGAFSGTGAHDWQPLIDWGYITTPQAVSLSKPHTHRVEDRRSTHTATGCLQPLHPLYPRQDLWRLISSELHGLPPWHEIIIPDVGRCRWGSELQL